MVSNQPTSYTVCLHHNDPDGRASAMIVRRALGSFIKLYEINYGDSIPWDLLLGASRVVMVDFSLPSNEMFRLSQGRELIWIDHHITAIQDCASISATWPGKRSLSEAACVLTWQYFFPGFPIPRAVVLIGDKDIWRMAEPETRSFSEGLMQENTRTDNLLLWEALLDDNREKLNTLVSKGQVLLTARINGLHRAARRYGYSVTFEGLHTLALNRPGEGELIEIAMQLGYELAYCYAESFQNGHLLTSVMIGSRVVDVSLIAKKFGGGGHPGAAGFQFIRTDGPFPPGADVKFGS